MTEQQMDYLLMVKYRILAEPGSLIMNYFKQLKSWLVSMYGPNSTSTKNLTCETVGCIAGHACMLRPGGFEGCSDVEKTAAKLLGLSQEEANGLFYFPWQEPEFPTTKVYANEARALKGKLPGTLAYAKVVARAIDKCIERNYKTRRRAA